MCLGELGLLSQSALVILLWTALFALPPLYSTSQQALDALIDEAIGFIKAVIDGGKPAQSQTSTLNCSAFLYPVGCKSTEQSLESDRLPTYP
jgi:hypothetical protein